ncbi:M15 family metallopeptidase [Candidatus Nomurabacteria bacterium]|nr:M15 family metallopeptidase [Candidatus Nomurabacteria bacterium]
MNKIKIKTYFIFILLASFLISSSALATVSCPKPAKSQGNVNHIFFSFSKKESNLKTYLPQNLVLIDKEYLKNGPRCLTKQSYTAFVSMNNALKEDTGQSLVVASAWRSLRTQQYFARTRPSFAAGPGRSEHQLGTTIDIHIKDVKEGEYFSDTFAYSWMIEHAQEYGFVQSFNLEYEDSTGIPNEPWHWRFVGKTIATKVKNENLNLNKYLQDRKDAKLKGLNY